jgi:hypothetical protein
MSKSRQTITESGASASRSESAKKVLDTERRFIDDLMRPRHECGAVGPTRYREVVLNSWDRYKSDCETPTITSYNGAIIQQQGAAHQAG